MMKTTMYFDGGCFPNPGTMDVGIVFTGDHNEKFYQLLSQGTNNQAEWYALLMGLELAQTFGITELKIIGDSQLVVKSILGEYTVRKAEFIPIYNDCKKILATIDWSIEYTPRACNLAGIHIEQMR